MSFHTCGSCNLYDPLLQSCDLGLEEDSCCDHWQPSAEDDPKEDR